MHLIGLSIADLIIDHILSAFYRYILIANSNRGHYVHFMNLDRQGLFPGKRMLVATVTNKESERVEKLNDTQVKNEVYDVLKKAYPNATVPSGKNFTDGNFLSYPYSGFFATVKFFLQQLLFLHLVRCFAWRVRQLKLTNSN